MVDSLLYIVISALCFIPAIILHEVAHGFAAYKLGDPTAKHAGRLTLNPLAHVDWFGTVVLPLLMAIMGGPVFGYAKPVPYNPRYFKDPRKGDLLVGLAGPFANLLLALAAAGIMHLLVMLIKTGLVPGSVYASDLFAIIMFSFLPTFVMVNLCLMFFNLLPIPPLDGSSIFAIILPVKYLPTYYKIQQYSFPIFMVLCCFIPYLFNINPIGIYLNATAGNLANLLFPF